MWELNHTFFSVLHLAKVFFDSDVPDEAKKDLGAWELDEDNCYVLGLEASVKVKPEKALISLRLPGGLSQQNESTCQTLLTGLMLYLTQLTEEYPDHIIVMEV